MITYLSGIDTTMDAIYKGFQIGFSDYMIKFEMSQEEFEKRFFGPEGNELIYSYIAFDDDKAIGVILGGIKMYEGVKTLRCGAFGVHPDYRGTEVSKRLFELHHQVAKDNQCKQMFLEVIVGNDRAINFYKRSGYEKVYDLLFYSMNYPFKLLETIADSISITKIKMDDLRKMDNSSIEAIHINWQNDFDYLERLGEIVHYGAYRDDLLTAFLSILPSGAMKLLWVEPQYRNQGIAKGLLHYAVKDLSLERLSINFPNNGNLLNFVKHMGFHKDGISLYEMYRIL